MDDLIRRKSAIDELCVMLRDCFGADDEELDAVTVTLNNMPPSQPTLYGYSIEHLAFIAKAMEKDGLSPEEVANLLRDTGYAVKFVIESLKEALEKINHYE